LTDHELLYGLKMTRLQEYLLDIEGNEIDEK
ncbi:MAG: pyridoxal kinase, partial [Lactobacillus iners]|nr:pyridoxal kinase [Lactobacillus iners]